MKMSTLVARFSPLTLLLTAGCLFGISLHAAQPQFVRVHPVFDEYGSGGIVDLEVQAEPGSMITLEYSDRLPGAQWNSFGSPVVVAGNGFMVFSVPVYDEGHPAPRRFFRFKVERYEFSLRDSGTELSGSLEQRVPAALLFDTLSRQLERDVILLGGADATGMLPPLKFSGANIADALADAGVRVWVTPPQKDLDDIAGQLVIREALQRLPINDAPGDIGRGLIEDGFAGIPFLRLPVSGLLEPRLPTANASKLFRPEIPAVADGIMQEIRPDFVEPGRHLRLGFEVDIKGNLRPLYAFSLPGEALPPPNSWPQDPPLDSLIWVVRSPLAGQMSLDQIYYIGLFDDPFVTRSYDPPFRGSHGHVEEETAKVRLLIPTLAEDVGLRGLDVKIYRYTQQGNFRQLDPTAFLRNPNSFTLLGAMDGDEMNTLIKISSEGRVRPQTIQPAASSRAATVTQLFDSGPRGRKFNVAIVGDGFRDTTTDQDLFNNYVQDVVLRDLLTRDVHPEILNSMNIFRINTYSVDSGITQVNSQGTVTTTRSTSLEYRYSGNWSRCWMEPGPNTESLISSVINALVPEATVRVVVLNTASDGGCARGSHFAVTRGVGWSVFAHEFGHFFATLQDEYQCNQGTGSCGSFTGSEPTEVNQTRTTVRDSIKWREWIPATRPVPTGQGSIADTSQDVGVFPGATRGSGQWWTGIYRPSWRGRMNDNAPPHNPVGYTRMRDAARVNQEADFRKSAVGDFDGDGRTDLVILDDRQLSLYLSRNRNVGPNDPVTGKPPRSMTGVLEPVWYHTDILRNPARTRSWEFRSGDILLPGDFDGDGKTDLYVVNLRDWSKPYVCLLKSTGSGFEPVRRYDRELPGWGDMRPNDEFYVGDFSGDGRDDLMVFNGRDWDVPYFLMLRSSGNSLVYSRRYDQYLPGWEMGRNEKFFVGDFNGDGRKEVISQNTTDWNQVHLMIFASTGSQLALTDRFYGEIRIGRNLYWTMRRQDELFLPNFDGDKTTDLAIFNGRDWTPEYLALFACVEGKLSFRRRYQDEIPGWTMRRRDRFHVADFNGDGRDDLVVFNSKNWSTQYLCMLRSNGDGSLQGSWQSDWIDAWNLSDADAFHVADFRGTSGWEDLFVYNKDWFGLLRSYRTRYVLEAVYPKWIHNHRYHAYGWW
jgi:hypothetical protein